MIDNAPIVIQAIRMVVDAVRAGQTAAPRAAANDAHKTVSPLMLT
jgi:hypothetical protein